jgi:sarcosine oxidase delta subunit
VKSISCWWLLENGATDCSFSSGQTKLARVISRLDYASESMKWMIYRRTYASGTSKLIWKHCKAIILETHFSWKHWKSQILIRKLHFIDYHSDAWFCITKNTTRRLWCVPMVCAGYRDYLTYVWVMVIKIPNTTGCKQYSLAILQ